MKPAKMLAAASALTIGVLTSGCGTPTTTIERVFPSGCLAFPAGVVNPTGVVSASIEVPQSVRPGETFTLKVNEIGVQDANVTDPPAAHAAGLTLSGPSEPTGQVPFGSLSAPATWPETRSITVTGQPGQSITIDLPGAGRNLGLFSLICQPSAPPARLVTIPIVAP